jgi:hypothetical protein
VVFQVEENLVVGQCLVVGLMPLMSLFIIEIEFGEIGENWVENSRRIIIIV